MATQFSRSYCSQRRSPSTNSQLCGRQPGTRVERCPGVAAASNWWSRVGRGFIRAWPPWMQPNVDVHGIYPRLAPMDAAECRCSWELSAHGLFTRNGNRMNADKPARDPFTCKTYSEEPVISPSDPVTHNWNSWSADATQPPTKSPHLS